MGLGKGGSLIWGCLTKPHRGPSAVQTGLPGTRISNTSLNPGDEAPGPAPAQPSGRYHAWPTQATLGWCLSVALADGCSDCLLVQASRPPTTTLWVFRPLPLSIDVGSSGWSGLPGGSGCQCGDVAGACVWPPGAGCARAASGRAGSLCGLCPGLSPGLPGPAGHLQCAKLSAAKVLKYSEK